MTEAVTMSNLIIAITSLVSEIWPKIVDSSERACGCVGASVCSLIM